MVTLRIDMQIREGEELVGFILEGQDRDVLLAELEQILGSSSPRWITLTLVNPRGYNRYVHGMKNVMKYLITGDKSLIYVHQHRKKHEWIRRDLYGWQVGSWDKNEEEK